MKTYVINQCGKFCIKVFLHYIDIVIFALGYFILPHPVEYLPMSMRIETDIFNYYFVMPNFCSHLLSHMPCRDSKLAPRHMFVFVANEIVQD